MGDRTRRERIARIEKTRLNGGVAPIPDSRHGSSAYVNWGCRCSVCKEAWRETCRKQQERRAAETKAGKRPVKHGQQGYKYGCRCSTCVDETRASRAQRRLDGLRGIRPARSHGLSGYNYSGCRCDTCLEAHRAFNWPDQKKRNDASREGARKHGQEWTSAELDLTIRTDLSISEIAVRLGRTRSAVANMRHKSRHDPRRSRNRDVQQEEAKLPNLAQKGEAGTSQTGEHND